MHLSQLACRLRGTVVCACLFLPAAFGQSAPMAANVALPEAPDASTSACCAGSLSSAQSSESQQQAASPSAPQNNNLAGKQTKRILGIVPNFRAVSVNQKLPPESVKDKFIESSEDAFDYSDFVFVAILAGVDQAEGSYPEFHQGAVGYGRYYWHTLVDQADEDYQVEFIFPALLHQDSRYYTLGRGGFVRRTVYAFGRILITRTDSGGETFNSSEIVGAGAAAGISDLYYPGRERTWTKTGQRWLLNVSLDGGTFIFKEFWPDLNNKFFHQKD